MKKLKTEEFKKFLKAPWVIMKESIKQILNGQEKKYISDPELTTSAVLVPIYEKDGGGIL